MDVWWSPSFKTVIKADGFKQDVSPTLPSGCKKIPHSRDGPSDQPGIRIRQFSVRLPGNGQSVRSVRFFSFQLNVRVSVVLSSSSVVLPVCPRRQESRDRDVTYHTCHFIDLYMFYVAPIFIWEKILSFHNKSPENVSPHWNRCNLYSLTD